MGSNHDVTVLLLAQNSNMAATHFHIYFISILTLEPKRCQHMVLAAVYLFDS